MEQTIELAYKEKFKELLALKTEDNHAFKKEKVGLTKEIEAQLKQRLKVLEEKGFKGFRIIEKSLKGGKSLKPQSAYFRYLCTDPEFADENQELQRRLGAWLELKEKTGNAVEMLVEAGTKSNQMKELLEENITTLLEESRELEQTYRNLQVFFENVSAEKPQLQNVSIIKASKKQLNNPDNTEFVDALAEEFKKHYDRFSLKDHYSLLLIPGWIGKATLEKLAKIAYKYKLLIVTDYNDLYDEAQEIINKFDASNLAGTDPHHSHVIMTCNSLLARKRYNGYEDEDFYISASSALAGKLYANPEISQAAGGQRFGTFAGVLGTKINFLKSEYSQLANMGLVPFIYDDGRVMAMGDSTLSIGKDIDKRKYTVVRVTNYLGKCLTYYCNKRALENYDDKTLSEIRMDINTFLRYLQDQKIIKKGVITTLEPNRIKGKPDEIIIDINITYLYPMKTFPISIRGNKETGHQAS